MRAWLSSQVLGAGSWGAARDAVICLARSCPDHSLALGVTCGLGYCRFEHADQIRFFPRRPPGSLVHVRSRGKRGGDGCGEG